MKKVIPTMHQGYVEIELLSFDDKTYFSTFKVKTHAFVTTEIILSGSTIESLYLNSKKLISEKIYKEE